MDDRSHKHYRMAVSVQKYMDDKTPIWTPIPIIPTIKTQIDGHIIGIQDNLEATGESSVGLTISKNDLREHIAIKAKNLSGAVKAFASRTGNKKLLKNCSFGKKEINNMKELDLPERMRHFTKLLTKHLAELADYGVTEAQITDLDTSVDDFRKMIGRPRLIRSEAGVANKSATDLLKEVMVILKEHLDNVMLQFEETNPAFHLGYLRARVIED